MSTPLVILCGKSDKPDNYHSDALPEAYKFAQVDIKGRELGSWALEAYAGARMAGQQAFGPVYLAGPRSVLKGIAAKNNGFAAPIRIIDCDGSLSENIRAIGDALRKYHSGEIATVVAGDLLPDTGELEQALPAMIGQTRKHDLALLQVSKKDMHAAGMKTKTDYGWLDAHGQRTRLVFGQIYCVNPDAFNWPLIDAVAGAIYKGRVEGLNRSATQLARDIYRGISAAGLSSHFWKNITPTLEKYTRHRFLHNVSLAEAEQWLEETVLVQTDGKSPITKMPIIPCPTLAFDLDRVVEKEIAIEALERRLARKKNGA